MANFLSPEIQDLRQATQRSFQRAGNLLAKQISKAAGGRPTVKTFAPEPRAGESPYALVSVSGPALATLSAGKGGGKVVILLPAGQKLGFGRIYSRGDWNKLFSQHRKHLSRSAVADGTVILYRRRGANIPIYKIQRAPAQKTGGDLQKLLERCLNSLPELIANNLEVL